MFAEVGDRIINQYAPRDIGVIFSKNDKLFVRKADTKGEGVALSLFHYSTLEIVR